MGICFFRSSTIDNHYLRAEQLRSTPVDKNSLEIFSNHVFWRQKKVPKKFFVSICLLTSTLGTVAPKKLWNFIAHEAHAKPKFELGAKKRKVYKLGEGIMKAILLPFRSYID